MLQLSLPGFKSSSKLLKDSTVRRVAARNSFPDSDTLSKLQIWDFSLIFYFLNFLFSSSKCPILHLKPSFSARSLLVLSMSSGQSTTEFDASPKH